MTNPTTFSNPFVNRESDQPIVTFAVVRNGAVWKVWDRKEDAILQANRVALLTEQTEQFHGFDESGKTAVVTRPVIVRVEMLDNNKTVSIVAEWTAGQCVELPLDRGWRYW